MKLQDMGHAIANPSKTLQLQPAKQRYTLSSYSSRYRPFIVNLLSKLTDKLKRKLIMGAKRFRPGGVEKIFAQFFRVKDGEKLLNTSQCYISTTNGPILGFLFISTHKISFCSEQPIKFSSKNGGFAKFHYKVIIPVGKISKVYEIRNVKYPSQKYVEIVTVDGFEIWFLGFVSYRKTLKYLQQSIIQPQ